MTPWVATLMNQVSSTTAAFLGSFISTYWPLVLSILGVIAVVSIVVALIRRLIHV